MPLGEARGPENRLGRAKLVTVLLFCLLNPFAGWAYLAAAQTKWSKRLPSISDTLKRKRVALLPLVVLDRASPLSTEWLGAMLSGLGSFDTLEVLVHPDSTEIFEPERDSLALGGYLGADLVLDASVSVVDGELVLFARLLRLADSSVLWSESFEGKLEDFESFCDDTVLGVVRTLVCE